MTKPTPISMGEGDDTTHSDQNEIAAAPESITARSRDEGVAADSTGDEYDALIADADATCERVAAKCAQTSASDAGARAELEAERKRADKAEEVAAREQGFRSEAEQARDAIDGDRQAAVAQRDKLAAALKRLTKRLKEAEAQ